LSGLFVRRCLLTVLLSYRYTKKMKHHQKRPPKRRVFFGGFLTNWFLPWLCVRRCLLTVLLSYKYTVEDETLSEATASTVCFSILLIWFLSWLFVRHCLLTVPLSYKYTKKMKHNQQRPPQFFFFFNLTMILAMTLCPSLSVDSLVHLHPYPFLLIVIHVKD